MDNEIKIRLATLDDAETLRAIYAPYVKDTAVTFDVEVPSKEVFAERVATVLKHYPYLIAEDADSAVGYTYAGKFRPREAYQRSVETSIYMRRDFRGKGVGRRMYNALAEILKLQNIYNMNACCAATPNPDDLYVPPTSIKFHERVGFKQVGRFSNCAYKFGNWYDMVWMERILMDHAENPNPGDFISLENVDPALIQEVLRNA